jgi:GGDEF domain-containing protein
MTQTLFKDRLEHTLACSERNQEAFAVLALRLNEISKIESDDTTTTLMCSAATCLSRRVRKRDSLARLSRDSFGVVIQGLSNLAAVNSTVGSLVMSLSDVSLPESLALAEGTMSTSVGVSLHPENGFDTAALMNRALQFEFATARIGSPTAQPGA